MLVSVNSISRLVCKPPCKFISGGKSICGKVGCSSVAELMGRLEAVHIQPVAAPSTLNNSDGKSNNLRVY